MKYLIDFVNTATDSEISSYLADNGCAVIKEWDNYDKVFLVECSVEPPKTSIIQFVVNDENELAIKPHDYVHFNPYYQTSHPDKLETISTSDQKDWWKNYSLQNPVFDEPTTTITRKGQHISVYVVDSGIEASHPEFVDANITNLYSVTGEFNDTSGHGTSLASVISGKTCGITNAKIKVIKIFDDNHTTMQSEFLDAMDAIINDLADNSFAIINCSWTIPRNEWVEHKLKVLIDKGAIIMAAAGNNGTSIEDVTPAAMLEAFTIGSYNMDLLPSDFSNYTDSHVSVTQGHTNSGELDGWAPGENIYSARLTSKGAGYAFVGGTSVATAICTAVMVHNFADEVDENGLRNASYVNVPPDVLKKNAVARKGILDLSDSKYASSVNVIATLFDLKSINVKLPSDELTCSIRVGQAEVVGQVFQAHYTKQVEIIQPLPDNFVILPNGMLHGAPVESQGAAEGETYKEYTSVVRRTNLDDTVEDVTITIYVLASNFDPGTLPPDHPIIITLALGNCFDGGMLFFSCQLITNPPCNNNCPNSACCDPGGKAGQCNCTVSDRRLKSNIKKIGTHSLGVGYYEYDIFGRTEQGVMADELLAVKPESVIKGNDGYYRVNYCMIGRQFA